jgi:hypothetical protein
MHQALHADRPTLLDLNLTFLHINRHYSKVDIVHQFNNQCSSQVIISTFENGIDNN